MNFQRIEMKSDPQVARIVKAAFPDYRKRDVYVSTFSELNINSYWDGGSKSCYVLLHVPTLERRTLTAGHPYFDIARHRISGDNGMLSVDTRGNVTVKALPQDCVIVEGGYFCGKTATAHVHYPPTNQLNAGEPAVEIAQ